MIAIIAIGSLLSGLYPAGAIVVLTVQLVYLPESIHFHCLAQ